MLMILHFKKIVILLSTFIILSFFFKADQVYGDQDMHDVVRKQCMDYLVSQFHI